MPPVYGLSKTQLEARAPLSSLDETRLSSYINLSLQTIIGLGLVIVLLSIALLQLLRVRLRQRTNGSQAVEYLILESEVSIEIGDEGVEIEYDDDDNGSVSMETYLSSAPPQHIAFDIDNLPVLHIDRTSGNILKRRGRQTMRLKASEVGDADMAMVDIRDGRLVVSPFSSRKEGAHLLDSPITRRRTPRTISFHNASHPFEIATAPHSLESSWRPLDTPDSAKEFL